MKLLNQANLSIADSEEKHDRSHVQLGNVVWSADVDALEKYQMQILGHSGDQAEFSLIYVWKMDLKVSDSALINYPEGRWLGRRGGVKRTLWLTDGQLWNVFIANVGCQTANSTSELLHYRRSVEQN